MYKVSYQSWGRWVHYETYPTLKEAREVEKYLIRQGNLVTMIEEDTGHVANFSPEYPWKLLIRYTDNGHECQASRYYKSKESAENAGEELLAKCSWILGTLVVEVNRE